MITETIFPKENIDLIQKLLDSTAGETYMNNLRAV